MINEFELCKLVAAEDGSKVPAKVLNNHPEYDMPSALYQGWQKAKQEGKLTGCGLMGNLTMDDIEDLRDRVDTAMTTWRRLSGYGPINKQSESKAVIDSEVFLTIKELTEEIKKLRKEVNDMKTENSLRQFEDLKAALKTVGKS